MVPAVTLPAAAQRTAPVLQSTVPYVQGFPVEQEVPGEQVTQLPALLQTPVLPLQTVPTGKVVVGTQVPPAEQSMLPL